jgi:gliding motility-associated-like protein
VEPSCYGYDTIQVKRKTSQTLSLPADTTICAGLSIDMSAPTGFMGYKWSTGDLQRTITVAKKGTYWVEATSVNGCKSRDTIIINNEACVTKVWVPTAFTPNGDGLNDLLKVLNPGGFIDFRFTVFNRLGQVVFATKDPQQGWDGTFKSKPSNGSYAWICNYRFAGDERQTISGLVTIIR